MKIKDTKNRAEKDNQLKHSCSFFFESHPEFNDFLKLVSEKTFDTNFFKWFISSYAHDNRIILKEEDIYFSFINETKSYQKKYFDYKSSGTKLFIKLNNYEIKTSVSQLNFMKWLCKTEFIYYVLENKEKLLKLYQETL